MKILMLCYEHPPIGGGGGKVAAGLSEELVRQGILVDFLSMGYRGLPSESQVNGVWVRRVPSLRLRKEVCTSFEMSTYLLSALPTANRLINQNPYTLIHAHFIFPDGVLAYWLKKKTGLPYILTAHGSDVPGYNPHRFRIEHRALLPFWRRVVQESAATVTASAHLAKLIQQQLPGHPVKRIYNAIQRQELSFQSKDPLHILVVSRLFERKGIQYLLQALDGIRIPFKVDIIGAGPFQAELERISRNLHSAAKVTFHGWVDQDEPRFWRFFESACIFVFPSEAENFPIVLLEAMAARTAIITTNDSGCAEVVGDSAVLVSSGDVEAIRQTLIKFYEHPQFREDLSQKAYQRLNQEFTWKSVAKRYCELYQQVG